jgi:hypothetical protein
MARGVGAQVDRGLERFQFGIEHLSLRYRRPAGDYCIPVIEGSQQDYPIRSRALKLRQITGQQSQRLNGGKRPCLGDEFRTELRLLKPCP